MNVAVRVGGHRRACCSCSRTASSRPASWRRPAAASTILAWARWRRSSSARRGRRPSSASTRIDTAGMSLDRRRKNGLVGHGAPGAGVRHARRGVRGRRRGGAVPARGARGRRGRRRGVRRGPGGGARRRAGDWASDADLAWRTRLMGWRCAYEPARGGPPHPPLQPAHPREHAVLAAHRAVPQPLPDDGQERPAAPRLRATCRGSSSTRCWRSASRSCASRSCCAATSRRRGCMPRMLRKRRELQRRRRARGAPPPPYGLEPWPDVYAAGHEWPSVLPERGHHGAVRDRRRDRAARRAAAHDHRAGRPTAAAAA